MPGVEKLSVAVTAEQAAMVREAVETGEYATAGEVVGEALRLWQAERQARAREAEELRRLWREGVESGPAQDGRAAFARLRQRIESEAVDSAAE
jgi:antitoxin ParD1/3/4